MCGLVTLFANQLILETNELAMCWVVHFVRHGACVSMYMYSCENSVCCAGQ